MTFQFASIWKIYEHDVVKSLHNSRAEFANAKLLCSGMWRFWFLYDGRNETGSDIFAKAKGESLRARGDAAPGTHPARGLYTFNVFGCDSESYKQNIFSCKATFLYNY